MNGILFAFLGTIATFLVTTLGAAGVWLAGCNSWVFDRGTFAAACRQSFETVVSEGSGTGNIFAKKYDDACNGNYSP